MKLPEYSDSKTIWYWIYLRFRLESLERPHAALLKVIGEELEAQGIQLGLKIAGDASSDP